MKTSTNVQMSEAADLRRTSLSKGVRRLRLPLRVPAASLLLAALLGSGPATLPAATYTIDPATDSYTADLPAQMFSVNYDPILANRSFYLVNKLDGRTLKADGISPGSTQPGYVSMTAAPTRDAASGSWTPAVDANTSYTWRLEPVIGQRDTYYLVAQVESDAGNPGTACLTLSPAGSLQVVPSTPAQRTAAGRRGHWIVTWDRNGWYRITNRRTQTELGYTADGFVSHATVPTTRDNSISAEYFQWTAPASPESHLWRFRASPRVDPGLSAYAPGKIANLRFGPNTPMAVQGFSGALPEGAASIEKILRWMGNINGSASAARSLGGLNAFAMLAAHRGVYGKLTQNDAPVPENSIAAIRRAAECGFETVELDVKLSRDGTLMLAHDYSTGRMMPSPLLSDYSESLDGLAEMKEWDPRAQPALPPGSGGALTLPAGVSEGGGAYRDIALFPDTPRDVSVANAGLIRRDFLPQNSGGHWYPIDLLNPLARNRLAASDFRGIPLWGFNRFSGTLAPGSGRTLSHETTSTLQQALQYIADEIPGMVVILDLRHADEVAEAINVIDAFPTPANGLSAKDWVVLKPFGNALPGGYGGIAGATGPSATTLSTRQWPAGLGAHAQEYWWIPVVSGRIKQGGTGQRSVRYYASQQVTGPAPDQPIGPDISALTVDTIAYLSSWNAAPSARATGVVVNGSVRGMLSIELGISPRSVVPGDPTVVLPNDDTARTKEAYYRFRGYARIPMIGPWRPSDICVAQDSDGAMRPFPFTGPFAGAGIPATLGYAWKDDGMGIYPNRSQTLLRDKAFTCDILTVDMGERVMATYLANGNRNAATFGAAIVGAAQKSIGPNPPGSIDYPVAIRSVATGCFLTHQVVAGAAAKLDALALNVGPQQGFDLIDINGGALCSGDGVYLRTFNGRYVSLPPGNGGSVSFEDGVPQFPIVISGTPLLPGAGIGAPLNLALPVGLAMAGGGGLSVRDFGQRVDGASGGALVDDSRKFLLVEEENHFALSIAKGSNAYFVGPSNAGGSGGVMTAIAPRADTYETFRIVDLNGGDLQDGDRVLIQTPNGPFALAAKGGGGDLLVDATVGGGFNPFTIFTIMNVSSPGGAITDGVNIALKSKSSSSSQSYYWRAEDGGGPGSGAVCCRTPTTFAPGAWETFTYHVLSL